LVQRYRLIHALNASIDLADTTGAALWRHEHTQPAITVTTPATMAASP